jgi:hypothetical protein
MREFKPKARYDATRLYKIVNLDWIKKELWKIYQGSLNDFIGRDLVIEKINDHSFDKNGGTVVFSAVGSAPKGQAIYLRHMKKLILIDLWGEKIVRRKNIIIEDLNAIGGKKK